MKKLILFSALLALANPALAQEESSNKNQRPQRNNARFENHQQHHKLSKKDRQQRWQQRYDNASPKKQERMDARRQKWENASPEERKAMRKKFRQNHQNRNNSNGEFRRENRRDKFRGEGNRGFRGEKPHSDMTPPPPHGGGFQRSREFGNQEDIHNPSNKQKTKKRFLIKKGAQKQKRQAQ